VNTQVTLQLKFLQIFAGSFFNVQNAPVQVTVTGANPMTATATTDGNGVAIFRYVGSAAGTDTVTASASSGPVSNSVPVTWVVAPPRLSTSPVSGRFFSNDGSGVFNPPATQQPVFAQTFPGIDFNPAAGTVPGNTSGVTNLTRPFTEVMTDPNGNFAGTI